MLIFKCLKAVSFGDRPSPVSTTDRFIEWGQTGPAIHFPTSNVRSDRTGPVMKQRQRSDLNNHPPGLERGAYVYFRISDRFCCLGRSPGNEVDKPEDYPHFQLLRGNIYLPYN